MAKVTLENVCKRYGDVEVVHNVNLDLPDRQLIVLVGPSGCGKSTTLRMVAGLEEISEGKVHIGDRLVNDVAPKDRDIAMVFQSYALYPHMTVRANLEFGLKMRGTPRAEIDQRVNEAAEILGITEYLSRKPKDLSGGQRQRVAMGRAIVRRPAVFLFDEPLSNLDAKLRGQMRVEIARLHSRLQTTTIYVTHDQVEAMTLADAIVVMKDGWVQQVGAPLDIYNKPANKFVAGFIGMPAMNFVEGEVSGSSTDAVFTAAGVKVPLTDSIRAALLAKEQRKAILGVRPPDFRVIRDGQEAAANEGVLTARVEVREIMGAEVFLHMGSPWGEIVVRVDGNAGVVEGDELKLAVSADVVHLFDGDDERNVTA